MRIEPLSLTPPPGAAELLADLGGGENGFSGTPVHSGEATLAEYLELCCEMVDPARLRPGLVPQTTFWVLNAQGIAVGMVRMRHCLNDRLRINGGHIGYYVRHDERGKGFAKEALRLVLIELGRRGEKRALLTVDLDNIPSISVIEANGGRLEDTIADPETGKPYGRYWIELALCQYL